MHRQAVFKVQFDASGPSLGVSSIADSSYYDKALIVKAGERLEPVRHGMWKLYVKIPEDTVKLYGVTGMGIKVTRKTR